MIPRLRRLFTRLVMVAASASVSGSVQQNNDQLIPYPAENLRTALIPIWRGGRISEEPILFIRDPATGEAQGQLLFVPTNLATVRDGSGRTTYERGRDYQWTPGSRTVRLPAGSRIVSVEPAQLRRPKNSQAYSLPHRDGGGDIFFGAKTEYQDLQTAITYDCAPGAWSGSVPVYAGEQLPRTTQKLQHGDPVRLVLLGDSISTGCNASGWAGVAPHLPPYGELVRRALAARFHSEVSLRNLSLGGANAAWGATRSEAVAEAQPDLLIVAFGANDAHRRPAADYQADLRNLIAGVRAKQADCEFILVSTMPGNTAWTSLQPKLYSDYRDALAALVGPGVAFADVTGLWYEMLRYKSYYDVTGNGVNHPNDFAHRVQAQVLLALLDPTFGAMAPP